MINILKGFGRAVDADDRRVLAQLLIVGSAVAGAVIGSAAIAGTAFRVFVAVAG